MSRDNVTPFRPRRKKPVPPGGGGGLKSHRGKAVLVQALALSAFAATFAPVPFLSLILGVSGVAIAASNRQEAMPWAATHHEHALRTIVIGAVIFTVLSLPGLVVTIPPGIGRWVLYVELAVLAWVAIRAGVGLVLASLRMPIWRPRGVLL